MIFTAKPMALGKNWDGLVKELFNELETTVSNVADHYYPATNIVETEEGYHFSIVAPGRKKEQFEVKVENNVLSIGTASEENKEQDSLKYLVKEFAAKSFNRKFRLGQKANADDIQAKYEDGILKIFIAKKPELKPETRSITVA